MDEAKPFNIPKRVVWKAFKRVKANQGSAGVDKQSSGVDLGTEVVSANVIYLATIWAIPVIIAITFHEAAHGFVAHLLGDDTAWRLGRVSFNPLKHVDPFGTMLLPGFLLLVQSPFLFGYAKPVPVNFRALRRPRREHGAGGRSRAGYQHCARRCRRSGVPHCGLSIHHQRKVARGKPEECIDLLTWC